MWPQGTYQLPNKPTGQSSGVTFPEGSVPSDTAKRHHPHSLRCPLLCFHNPLLSSVPRFQHSTLHFSPTKKPGGFLGPSSTSSFSFCDTGDSEFFLLFPTGHFRYYSVAIFPGYSLSQSLGSVDGHPMETKMNPQGNSGTENQKPSQES